MDHCELCDLPRSQCPHGRAEASQARSIQARELLVSPAGLAHFPGCPHKGEDDDYSRWGVINLENVWTRIGNGEQIQATGGENPVLIARDRCRDCIEHGPW